MKTAQIENNIVTNVIEGSAEWATERLGGSWVQVDDNKNSPAVGYTYHPESNNFSSPQPFPSWTLNNNFTWDAPALYPGDETSIYLWDENNLCWTLMN